MDEKYNLLLVDDHQIILDGVKSILAFQSKYVVKSTALNGQDALSLIENDTNGFDIVISDISMEKMDGLELCKHIKHINSNVKVIMFSMYNDVQHVKQALECEADGYLLKNTGQEELIKALDTLIDKGTYFTQEIIPLLYKEIKEKKPIIPEVKLTQREIEVLELITKEFTSREIAEKLFISKQTVDTHRINLIDKTGSRSVVGLMKYAISNNIISLN
mgnify:CR=1 FL=1